MLSCATIAHNPYFGMTTTVDTSGKFISVDESTLESVAKVLREAEITVEMREGQIMLRHHLSW
jgi:hypothetical protein